MEGTHGFANMPKKDINYTANMFKNNIESAPGLSNFYFTGVWATSAGALFVNAQSGKNVIRHICKEDGKKFVVYP